MEGKRVPKIFISYRRDDTAGFATLLEEKLEEHFGADNVFRDLSDIRSGSHFKLIIQDQIKSCDILLAVIGKGWVATLRERVEKQQEDFVRFEIATALDWSTDVAVVPVLVQEAQSPSKADLTDDLTGLLELSYSEISLRWTKQDIQQLIEHLEKTFEESTGTKTNAGPTAVDSTTSAEVSQSPEAKPRNSRLGFYGGSVAALLSGTVVGISYTLSIRGELWRPFFVAGFAFVVGVIISGSISYGVDRFSSWLNGSRLSKLIGSIAGGTVGGILSAILAGLAFSWLKDTPLVATLPIAGAVIVSNVVVAGGMLLPELRAGGDQRKDAVITLAASSLIIFFAVGYVLNQNQPFLDQALSGSSIINGLIAGAAAGFVSGIQIGSALFVCSRPHQR